MPDSVLMPAPVKTTARRLLRKISLSRSIGELPVLKPVIDCSSRPVQPRRHLNYPPQDSG
jgi:hypothetical protein